MSSRTTLNLWTDRGDVLHCLAYLLLGGETLVRQQSVVRCLFLRLLLSLSASSGGLDSGLGTGTLGDGQGVVLDNLGDGGDHAGVIAVSLLRQGSGGGSGHAASANGQHVSYPPASQDTQGGQEETQGTGPCCCTVQ